MKRHLLWSLTIASCVMLAGSAWAQSSSEGTASAAANASGDVAAQQRLEAIKDKGAQVDARARAKAEAKLDASAKSTDQKAEAQGEATVAARLAKEFGTTTDAIMSQKAQLETSFGQLMIAHTLSANAGDGTNAISVDQLFELRGEGMGWGQIAAGLGFNLGSVVSAVQSENRVAIGLSKPDGMAASVRSELPRGAANAGVHAGAGLGSARVGTDVSGAVKIGR